MNKLEKKNHYERVFSVDDEGNITSWELKTKREEIVIQERKELTDKQRAYLNRNDELKSYCKSLGGYVHMLYVKNELLFNNHLSFSWELFLHFEFHILFPFLIIYDE